MIKEGDYLIFGRINYDLENVDINPDWKLAKQAIQAARGTAASTGRSQIVLQAVAIVKPPEKEEQ